MYQPNVHQITTPAVLRADHAAAVLNATPAHLSAFHPRAVHALSDAAEHGEHRCSPAERADLDALLHDLHRP